MNMFTASSSQEFAVAAMQEIEVVSMDDGEDNVTLSSVEQRPHPSAAIIESSPPPPPTLFPSLSSSSSSSSSPQVSSSRLLPPMDDDGRLSSQDEALEVLHGMLSNERTLPKIDHAARLHIKGTPISISGISNSSSGADPTSNLLDNDDEDNTSSINNNNNNNDNDDPVNDHDRTKMCDWYYEMSDFLKIDRSTASRSLTLLDRFMTTPIHHHHHHHHLRPKQPSSYNVAGVIIAASQNRDEYQLVALTALFLSIKLYERLNIQPEHVSYLSRGRYTSDEVIQMEIIMLQALEWRVCVADKVDYVEAYLNVLLPDCGIVSSNKRRRSRDDPTGTQDVVDQDKNDALSTLQDLANLQIQLSDFDPSYSTQRPSLVAFASVINAFEMKKDKLFTIPEQHSFLRGIESLMNRMYPLNDHMTLITSRNSRHELGQTVDRLRILVDPPSVVQGGYICGVGNVTPTTYQHQEDQRWYQGNNKKPSTSSSVSYAVSDLEDNKNSSSRSSSSQDVSPFDMALESMENFDMAQLLCCGSHGRNMLPCHPEQQQQQVMYTKNVYNDHHMETDGISSNDESARGANTHNHHPNFLESASSFTSIDNGNKILQLSKSHSPTSIAFLFGGANTGAVKN